MRTYDEAVKYAADLGREHGRNAASWYTIDDEASAARLLRGIDDGDPEILDTIPSADLSGQWADSLDGPELVRDAFDMDEDEDDTTAADDAFGDVCDAYELAFDDAAADEVARMARIQVA